jgi:hypothetical protein
MYFGYLGHLVVRHPSKLYIGEQMKFSTAEVLSTNLRQKHTIALFAWLISHQKYFSLGTNQPPTTNQQYFSLITNQLQPSATSQTNKLHVGDLFTRGWTNGNDDRKGDLPGTAMFSPAGGKTTPGFTAAPHQETPGGKA